MARTPRGAIASRLKAAILATGVTQRQFAGTLGVQESAVSKWLRVATQPDLETFAEICKLTGVSADEILGLPMRGPAKLPPGTAARLSKRIDELEFRVGKALDDLRSEIAKASSGE